MSTPSSHPSPHIIPPLHPQTHTIILFHGRGATGPDFATELFESSSSLKQVFPSARWVFPSSRQRWSTVFQEYVPAWFEAVSVTDTPAEQDDQVEGIREGVMRVGGILDEEIGRLGGDAGRVVLGGISQGGAIAMWTLLHRHHTLPTQTLGAFIGLSTWLPFAANLRQFTAESSIQDETHTPSKSDTFVKETLSRGTDNSHPSLTPVFFGHGTDDAYVDVEVGREAADLFSSMGFTVEWKDYVGAEQEGHWIKEPEELDDIREFLAKQLGL